MSAVRDWLNGLDRVERAWVTLWAVSELTGRDIGTPQQPSTTSAEVARFLHHETPLEVAQGVLGRMPEGFRKELQSRTGGPYDTDSYISRPLRPPLDAQELLP